MLDQPNGGRLLYKVMTIENLVRSVKGSYLHFNRVNSYSDFPGADQHDGQQSPTDRPLNEAKKFRNAPQHSLANYYDQCRARTYACCFSLENSDHIWRNFGNGSELGKVCVVFEFGKLRATLNETLSSTDTALFYGGIRCRPIFSINYGLIDYVDWEKQRLNSVSLANPIEYTYMKDAKFLPENELRISLSALGIGKLVLNDGMEMEFPKDLQMTFDFRRATATNVIREVKVLKDEHRAALEAEFRKQGISLSVPGVAEPQAR